MKTHSNDAGSEEPHGQRLVLAPEGRERHDGGADVRDDEQQLEEGRQVDAGIDAATGEYPEGFIEHRLVEVQRRDRRHERDEEEHSGDPGAPLGGVHPCLQWSAGVLDRRVGGRSARSDGHGGLRRPPMLRPCRNSRARRRYTHGMRPQTTTVSAMVASMNVREAVEKTLSQSVSRGDSV